MPLKQMKARRRSVSVFSAIAYRIPMPVTKILRFPRGGSYPVCPHCDNALDREYMSFCDCCGQKLAWGSFALATVVQAPRRSGGGSAADKPTGEEDALCGLWIKA